MGAFEGKQEGVSSNIIKNTNSEVVSATRDDLKMGIMEKLWPLLIKCF